MTLRAPSLLICTLLVAVGVLILLATAVATLQLAGRFNARGPYVTVPATVELTLEPGVPHAVARELAGPHATVNNPIEDTPDDLAVTVTDAATGRPVETEPYSWWYRQNLFGSSRHRVAVRRFVAPPSGRVVLSVQGDFQHPQIFAVAPTIERFKDEYSLPLASGLIGGALLVLLGVVLAIARVANPPDLDSEIPR